MSIAESEMWDAIAGVPEPRDTRKRLLHSSRMVAGHSVTVSRITGTRRYVVAVGGSELPGSHDWTVDAINAGTAYALLHAPQPCRGCGQPFPHDPDADYCPQCAASNAGEAS